MNASSATIAHSPQPERLLKVRFVAPLLVLALVGAGISFYLAWTAWSQRGLPIGCGAGGGCAQVLTSRWAGTWGIPVAFPAATLWMLAVFAVASGSARLVVFAACSVVLAAIWFVAIQLVVLRAVCPWCMADHATGLLFGVLAWRAVHPSQIFRIPTIAAMAGVAALLLGQFAVPYKPGRPAFLASAGGGDGVIEVGAIRFSSSDTPSLGAAEGRATIVLLADYACPHCRATHGYLMQFLAADPKRFQILVAPVPMNHDCNRTLVSTEPRFEHSCELATLALAVWTTHPSRFAAFDTWLFDSEMPRPPNEARAEAERLVGRDALGAALKEPAVSAAIARNVDAFEAAKAKRLPVLLRNNGPSIEGEPNSAEEFDLLLTDSGRPSQLER